MRSRIARKRVKLFKRRDGQIYDEDLLDFEAQGLNQEHEEEDVMLEGNLSDESDED